VDIARFKTIFYASWGFLTAQVKKKPIIRGECNTCGACCRDLRLMSDGEWIDSEDAFIHLVKKQPDYSIFRPRSGWDESELYFSCTRLGQDGKCQNYKKRPNICRTYPEKMVRRGGKLLRECSYQVIPSLDFKTVLGQHLKEN
jgi:uncharacterized protein